MDSNDVNKVYDFTSWANIHYGGSPAITKWTTNFNLKYPHDVNRWNNNKSNFGTAIGSYGQTINYNDLPSNLKSTTLYNSLFPEETTTTTQYVAVEDLGFDPM